MSSTLPSHCTPAERACTDEGGVHIYYNDCITETLDTLTGSLTLVSTSFLNIIFWFYRGKNITEVYKTCKKIILLILLLSKNVAITVSIHTVLMLIIINFSTSSALCYHITINHTMYEKSDLVPSVLSCWYNFISLSYIYTFTYKSI